MNYRWKQRSYSFAHLVDENGVSLCRQTRRGGKWIDPRPNRHQCRRCKEVAEKMNIATAERG